MHEGCYAVLDHLPDHVLELAVDAWLHCCEGGLELNFVGGLPQALAQVFFDPGVKRVELVEVKGLSVNT